MNYYVLLISKIILHCFAIYATSVTLSTGMLLGVILKFFKNLALDGKKLDTTSGVNISVTSYNDEEKESVSLKKTLLSFGKNVYVMFQLSLNYNHSEELLRDLLNDNIVPMTDIEQEKFNKHPNGLNAYLINYKSFRGDTRPIITLVIYDEMGNTSTVDLLLKRKKYKILNIDGPLAEMNKKEQERIILEYLTNWIVDIQENCETPEEVIETIANAEEIKINKDDFINPFADIPRDVFNYPLDGGSISWRYTESFDDIEIVESIGSANNYTIEEQKDMIIEDIKHNFSQELAKYGSIEKYVEALETEEENKRVRKK